MKKTVMLFVIIVGLGFFLTVSISAVALNTKEVTVAPNILDPRVQTDLEPVMPILISPQLIPAFFGPNDYFIWYDHGGWWYDSEKTVDNYDDDLMCWASACSNSLEYTGWGQVTDTANGDLTDTEEMFANYNHYWVDRGGWMNYGWSWWFDGEDPDPGEGRLDITGSGGDYWPTRDFLNYYHMEDDMPEVVPRIDEHLRAGYPVTLAIRPSGWGGHAITCWGFRYDPTGYSDRHEHPENYYMGLYVTDSDDDKSHSSTDPPPNTLRYYNVTYNDVRDKWYLDYAGSSWYIELIMSLEPPDPAIYGRRPTAAFSSVDGYTGDVITFDASASSDPDGDPLQYRWDFDDDGFWDTSWTSSPIVTRTWDEEYDGYVLLEVFDGTYKDVHQASADIIELVHIDFLWNPRLTDAGFQIQFNDASMMFKEEIVDWTWEVPGMESVKGRDPKIVFDDVGSYDVKLTLRYKDGSTKTLTRSIEVSEATADFTWNPMPQVEGSAVQFKDASTTISTPIVSWSWDFGDSTSSNEQNPKHVYEDDGSYEVTLTVANKDKTRYSVTHTVTILDMGPAAGFITDPRPATVGEPVTFADLSKTLQDDLVSWQWDFSDGTTSSEQNPVHTFTKEGTPTVRLTVTDEDGSFDVISIPVTVNEPTLFDYPRLIYSQGDPTPTEQHILELINHARADPYAEGKRLGIDVEAGIQSEVTPQPPLAMNLILHGVAQAHCADMRKHGFSQTDSQGYSYKERMKNAGYPGTPVSENIASGDTAVDLYKLLVREVDPKAELNHREILLGIKYTQNEVGVGYTESSGRFDSFLTIDYGYQSEEAFILGVVYLDKDKDGFYDVGEGLSGVTVMPSAGTYYAVTSTSGGYAIPMTTTGLIMVTASGGDLDTPISRVVETMVPGDNVKLDFIVSPGSVESYELEIKVEGKGETNPESGVHKYETGSSILLSAAPEEGWEFSHWEMNGQTFPTNPYELVLDKDHQVKAVFTESVAVYHSLVIEVEGEGTTDPQPGTMEMAEGEAISVEALPEDGWEFVEWMLNGETAGDDNPYEITMDKDMKLIAIYMKTKETTTDEEQSNNPVSQLIESIMELINKILSIFGGK